MKALSLFLSLALLTLGASADENSAESINRRGINENVQISFLEEAGVWGFSYENTDPFVRGTAQGRLIPVTEESFDILNSLDRNFEHSCTLLKSTVVAVRPMGEDFYVIAIQCD